MKKMFLVILTVFLLSSSFYGQTPELYSPLNIQKAIVKGTRSIDGNPGNNYWQNKSEYRITAEILPDSSYLIGDETIIYHNNSPDSLKEIIIRLYQDISKIGAVRDWYVGKDRLNDGVKINYLILDNDTLDLSPMSIDTRRGSTNLIIKPINKIAPSSRIELKIGWEFEVSKDLIIRMGNYGNGNLYVAYWYPQIAVYDDIDGWDRIDYSGSVEFYNDFSNYDVTLKIPKGMVVWATGELQNGKEVLRADIYSKYEQAKESDETIRIITQEDYSKGLVTNSNEINEWHFKASNVTDFTFSTSKSFNWDGASVVVDSSAGRRVLTDVVYQDSTIHYDEAAQYARATIEYLSNDLPGYPYPYSHATSYCNGRRGGGMESPMMANDGAPRNRARHIGLIFHEIAHNYFPFIMGINERKYAWMDEGMASFLPTDIVNRYEPEFDYQKRRILSYLKAAGRETDLPLVTPSYSYKTNTGLGFYDRPAIVFYELKELLGEELFKKGLLEFMNRWEGKHPIPQDFFLTFNEVAEEDLTWFWKPWFYEFGYPDLAITNVETGDGFVSATINRIGNIPTGIEVTFEFDDGTLKSLSKSVRVWKDGKKELIVKLETSQKIKSVKVGSNYIPDSVEENNVFTFSE